MKPKKSRIKVVITCLVSLIGCLLIWLFNNSLALQTAAQKPVDAFLVLGGSIQREIYAAQLAKESPQIPLLISGGSPNPCIFSVFQQSAAPMQKVWLENCADSTFKNFYFALPILKKWHVHHLQLITSASHLPRAMRLAQVMLGSHQIWVELNIVSEIGIPGNQESFLKTAMDLTRGCIWALISQVIQPQCSQLTLLHETNMAAWCQRGFRCEYQGNIDQQVICQNR